MSKTAKRGMRFLTVGELHHWSDAGEKHLWQPVYELTEDDFSVTLTVELPGCGAPDIQIALLPRVVILRRELRLLASRTWREAFQVLFGCHTLFRRFDMPSLIDVNRVRAELDMGVLTLIALKPAAREQPAHGVPDRPHVSVS